MGRACSRLPQGTAFLLQERRHPVAKTGGALTAPACLSPADPSLQSNGGPTRGPWAEAKMKAINKSAAGVLLHTRVSPLLIKTRCLLRVQAWPPNASLLTTPHVAFQVRQAGNV